MQLTKIALTIASIFAALGAQPASAAAIVDLGTLGGASSFGYGINNLGQVTGVADAGNNQGSFAFLYSNGVMQNLGTFGNGLDGVYYQHTAGVAINNSGQVVGNANAYNNPIYNGTGFNTFLYSNGAMQNIPLPANIAADTASAINNAGQVTLNKVPVSAYAYNYPNPVNNGPAHAYLYSNGGMTDLGTLCGISCASTGDSSSAFGINDAGVVAGMSATSTKGVVHAFIYSNGVMKDINTFSSGTSDEGLAINNAGQVTGWYSSSTSGQQAFLYTGGQMVSLGSLGGPTATSQGNAIDSAGQVVGWAYVNANTQHAFLYSKGSMLDLNSLLPANSGWVLTSAQGINDNGQITGYGTINGQTRAFLLSGIAPVPEPETYALMIAGLGLLGVASRRRNR